MQNILTVRNFTYIFFYLVYIPQNLIFQLSVSHCKILKIFFLNMTYKQIKTFHKLKFFVSVSIFDARNKINWQAKTRQNDIAF